MIFIVGCTKDSNSSTTNTDIDIEAVEYVAPTEDLVAVKSSLQSYISPNVLNEGFERALRNRLTNQISSIEDDNAEFLLTMVIHNSDLQRMTSDVDFFSVACHTASARS